MSVFILRLQQKISSYEGASYSFRGAKSIIKWPRENGAFLGEVGAWNFLWRLGYHPQWLAITDTYVLTNKDMVFLCASTDIDTTTINIVRRIIRKDVTVILSGYPKAFSYFLPDECRLRAYRYDNPYAALAYLLKENVPELLTPPNWTYMACDFTPLSGDNVEFIGRMAAIHGERQTPHRALITKLDGAPAIIKRGKFFYLNGNPFAAFQSWLQGQEDLAPWLSWRHRIFWLDEWVAFLGKLLLENGAFQRHIPKTGIEGLKDTTLVIRHDLDSSRDTSYLTEELTRGFPAVHAVLRDKNQKYWVNILNKYPDHEIAFHYNTIARFRIRAKIESLLGVKARPYKPAYKEINCKGLEKQVKWAKSNGIKATTLHRHGSFLIYPEWIDAYQKVLDSYNNILGGSCLFRSQVLRWGVDRVDNIRGFVANFPDVQFPLWYPFKLAHAGYDGEILKGWQSTSIMEIEPEFFEQLLDYKVPGLLQRVFVLNYHPAHANSPTFCRGGSFTWFKRILDIAVKRELDIVTLEDLFLRSNQSISREAVPK